MWRAQGQAVGEDLQEKVDLEEVLKGATKAIL